MGRWRFSKRVGQDLRPCPPSIRVSLLLDVRLPAAQSCRDLGVSADDLMRPPPGRSGFKPSDVLIPEIKQPRQAPRRTSSGLGFLPFLGIGGILIATACALGRRRN